MSNNSIDPRKTPSGEEHVSVSQVASRMRQFEDENLAHRLQSEEFGQHYEMNRTERRQVGGDCKKSREEQQLEDRFAAEYRAQLRRDSEQRDAEYARRLQEQLEMEERRKKEEQTRIDAELASRLQSTVPIESANEQGLLAEDEALAARLQEMYNRRGTEGRPSEENRQNQMNDERLSSRDRADSLPLPSPPPPLSNVVVDASSNQMDLISFDDLPLPLHPTNPFAADIVSARTQRSESNPHPVRQV